MSLFDAIVNDNLEECEKLIKSGIDVNQISTYFYECTPLDLALIYNRKNMYDLLRQNGGKLKYFITAILNNICDSNYDDLKFILKKIKIDLNDQEIFNKICPLFLAIYSNSTKIVKLLLEYEANPFLEKRGELLPEDRNNPYIGKKLSPIQYTLSFGVRRQEQILAMLTFFEEKNNKIRCLLALGREHDEKSLLHRDYLPLDMFRLIFRDL